MENSDKSVFENAKLAGNNLTSSRFFQLLFRSFENLKNEIEGSDLKQQNLNI